VKPLKIWVMIDTSFLILISRYSSRMMPDSESRNSGICLAEIPEFRDLEKWNFGKSEILNLQSLATVDFWHSDMMRNFWRPEKAINLVAP
jgi:hypothetical protein